MFKFNNFLKPNFAWASRSAARWWLITVLIFWRKKREAMLHVNPLSRAPDYCLSRAERKYRSRAFFTFLNGSGFSISGIFISDESQASALSSFIGHIGFLQSWDGQKETGSWELLPQHKIERSEFPTRKSYYFLLSSQLLKIMIENNKNLNKNDVFIISPEKKTDLNLVFLFFSSNWILFFAFYDPSF